MADQTKSGQVIIPLTDGNVQVGGYVLNADDIAKVNAISDEAKKLANSGKAKSKAKTSN